MTSLLSTMLMLVLIPVTAEKPKTEPTHTKIYNLKLKRRDVLKQLVTLHEKAIRAGAATPESMLKASIELAEAELELARNEKERVRILKRNYELFVRLESRARAAFKVGAAGVGYVLSTQAKRLKAEIRWLAAKSDAE